MSLDLGLLKTFMAVADTRNFSQAGSNLFLTQQAVSAQVQRLEDHLGVKLFIRSTRRVDLTSAGESLLEHANRLLKLADEVLDLVQKAGRTEQHRITIGYTHSCSWFPLPQTLAVIADSLSSVELFSHEMYESDIASALVNGVIDFGLTRPPMALPGITGVLLSVEPLLVAMAASCPLSSLDEISLGDIADLTLLLWPRHLSSGYYEVVSRVWTDAGFTPHIDVASTGPSLWSRVAAGEGVALVPKSMKAHLPPGTSIVALREVAEIGVGIARSKTHQSDRIVGAFDAVMAAREQGVFRLAFD